VVVTRSDDAGLAHTLWTLGVVRDLAKDTSSVVIVVIGSSQFLVGEIEQVFQTKLVSVFPFDEKSAAIVCGSPGKTKRFARSSLVVSARRLVDRLMDHSTLGDVTEGRTGSIDDLGPGAAPRSAIGSKSNLELAACGERDADLS
jgi:hypothetical protein